uniref:Secreted protein n=1 Tax=Setaria digitata TaxID=48799 RepID=A0A915PJ93_9BILA
MGFYIIMLAAWSLIAEDIVVTADDSDYDYLDNDLDENQKPADVFWGDVLDDEQQKERNSSSVVRRRNCSTETVIIDKLLNGTGYNKYRLPCKLYDLSLTYFA